MGYHKTIIEYYNKELERLYKEISNSNYLTPFISSGLEEFDEYTEQSFSTKLISFLNNLSKIIKALFVRLSLLTSKISKRYITLSNKYSKQIIANRNNINETNFLNTKIKSVSYQEQEKRIDVVKTLCMSLDKIDNIIKEPGNVETYSIKKCLADLTSIGYDPNSQNLIKSKLSSIKYKDKYTVTTIKNHGYTINNVLKLLNDMKYLDRYTSNNYIKTLNAKFYHLSETIQSEQDTNKAQVQTMRLWICTHFIKTTYTLASNIVDDIIDVCDEIIKNTNI